jgi:class 3 adenylate cyclase
MSPDAPEVKYAKSGDVHIAYQTLGTGVVDVVFAGPATSHLSVWWEWPPMADFFRQLASFSRLIMFDKRGVGLSDRAVGIAPLGERTDDIRAVMDACASKSAVLFGASESGPMAILFAATYPERTRGLVIFGATACERKAPDFPWGATDQEWDDYIHRVEREWGTVEYTRGVSSAMAPGMKDDPDFLRWHHRLMTFGASPASAIALHRMNREIDVRPVLSAVQAPCLVLAPAGRESEVEANRYISDRIPGARFLAIPGASHLFPADPKASAFVLRAFRGFVEGLPGVPEVDRTLTTVLFTDIVESTKRVSELGDRAWGQLLDRLHDGSRVEVERFRGKLIKSTGDGILATFDGPTRAIRCASAIRRQARDLGIEVRAGLHTGECLVRGGDVQGIAIHIASRVGDEAQGGEILVSSTVRDLSVGSDIKFRDRGLQTFRGVEGEWRTYTVVNS